MNYRDCVIAADKSKHNFYLYIYKLCLSAAITLVVLAGRGLQPRP